MNGWIQIAIKAYNFEEEQLLFKLNFNKALKDGGKSKHMDHMIGGGGGLETAMMILYALEASYVGHGQIVKG